MTASKTYLSIGETSRRTGVAASALRFYETRDGSFPLVRMVRAFSVFDWQQRDWKG